MTSAAIGSASLNLQSADATASYGDGSSIIESGLLTDETLIGRR
jgi:hypothetical protein